MKDGPISFDEYVELRRADDASDPAAATRDPEAPVEPPSRVPGFSYVEQFKKGDTDGNMLLNWDEFLAMQPREVKAEFTVAEIRAMFDKMDSNQNGLIDPNEFLSTYGLPPLFPDTEIGRLTDKDESYRRTPWWQQGSAFSEMQRKDRRTIFMHDDWVRHRSNGRFLRNMKTLGSSGINQALSTELSFMTMTAIFVVIWNMVFSGYQDFGGLAHPGLLSELPFAGALKLPSLPFTVAMPALSLLLVFRANQGYSRWNEARTLWGGLINNCRNIVRQSNGFFPDDEYHKQLKPRMAAETKVFIVSLRNFLRGPADDVRLRSELYEMVNEGLISREQADANMDAANRPMFALNAMSMTLRKANIEPMHKARIDQTISTLVDLTGANERIFKSPIPLVYTRLLSRFLSFFLILLPLGLWAPLSESWNHWATIPAELFIAYFLLGIEEVGIQIEEPFSVLPLEAFCNGAISATNQEMLGADKSGVFLPDDF